MSKKRRPKSYLIAGAILSSLGLAWAFFTQQETAVVNAEVTTTPSITSEFIANIGETARQIGQERDLYASVMIAQAILESSSGQSALSQAPYYNYFGIKGDYNGNSVSMLTLEDDGTGNTYQVAQDFRSYGSPSESLTDYANLLSTDLYVGTHKSNTTSYQDATAALTGLYATDTSYNLKLNSLIESYGLTAYDSYATTSGDTSSETVWNSYRGTYTDAETLAEDQAWASYTAN